MFRTLSRRLPRIGRRTRLLLAALCLLLAAGTALEAHPRAPLKAARTVPVVVAARDLPAGHVLSRRDLTVRRWPPALCPADVWSSVSSLVGRRTAAPVASREAITATRLVTAHLVDGLDPRLVAAPVPLDDPHALVLVRAGDRVDLLEAARRPDLADAVAPPSRVSVLTQDALVLAALPASDAAGAELILAVDRPTAVRITRDSASQVFTAIVDPP